MKLSTWAFLLILVLIGGSSYPSSGPSLSPHPPSSDIRHHGPWMPMADQAHPAWPSPTLQEEPDLFQRILSQPQPELMLCRWNNLPRASSSAGCNFPFTLLPCLSLLFALPAVACPAAAPNRIGWLGKWECNPSPRSSREAPLSHFTLHYPTSAPQSFFSSRTLTASLHFNSFEPCPTVSRVTDETNHRRRNSNVPAVWQFISSLHSQRKHPPPSVSLPT